MKWADLFNYVSHKVFPPHLKHGNFICYHNHKFTEIFCDMHGLNFETIKQRLEDTGGFCDCEVIFNSSYHIPHDEEI